MDRAALARHSPAFEKKGRLRVASKQLHFLMERQQQPNWCWAAAAASAGNFFSPGSSFAQCGIATVCLGDNACCRAPYACNRYHRLDTALKAAQCFFGIEARPELFENLKLAIEAERPVGVRIGWRGGGGHFVMLTGYDDENAAVAVDDPHYGRSTVRFDAFPASYKSGGDWTHSYATRGS